ncbi:hypothetical protein BOX15_Mlig002392g1, partial [Macrostomum lignano]
LKPSGRETSQFMAKNMRGSLKSIVLWLFQVFSAISRQIKIVLAAASSEAKLNYIKRSIFYSLDEMPRKCSVFPCSSNYNSEAVRTRTFAFPRDPQERERWRKALPNILQRVTDNMGVCVKHWPSDAPMVKKNSTERPINPPSVFNGVPSSCFVQNQDQDRQAEKRGVLSDARCGDIDEMDAFQLLDFLPAWESFRAEVKNSDVVSRHALNTAILNEDVYLFTLDKDGDLSVRIFVSPNFLIRAFKLHTPISVRDLLGFQPTLKRWSQLDAVVVRCKNSDANPQREVEAFVSRISDDIDSDSDLDPSLQFLIRQLSLTLVNWNNRRYDISLVRQSALLYLISSSAYSYLRKLLPLPHPRTLQLQLAGTGEVGTETDAADVIQSVFASLSGARRNCVICLTKCTYNRPFDVDAVTFWVEPSTIRTRLLGQFWL